MMDACAGEGRHNAGDNPFRFPFIARYKREGLDTPHVNGTSDVSRSEL
jgi:hypothetical protein